MMKTSLVITTYNNPDALHLVLLSLQRQTLLPAEVVVADDGSTDETRRLLQQWRSLLPCPIVHVWQEDRGYRRSRILNKAFAKATGDYLINIDGDIIMEKHFIADHVRYARKGYFGCGGRVRLGPTVTKQIYVARDYRLHFFTSDLTDRFNLLRMPLLTPLFFNRQHLRGCNIAFWRDDLIAVNGYDEQFEGWGLEDYDIANRLKLIGRRIRHIKFSAIEYHLYHPERSNDGQSNARNEAALRQNMQEQRHRAKEGMDKYLNV